MEEAQHARQLLDKTIYAAVATVSDDGMPWNSPVFVVFDEQYTFYWASAQQSQHSRNIAQNGRAFLVVFDSGAPWGSGEGVFIEAQAVEVTDIAEIERACKLRFRRAEGAQQPVSDFTGAVPRRIYRAIPQRVWVNKDATQKGYFVDARREVSLEHLRAA